MNFINGITPIRENRFYILGVDISLLKFQFQLEIYRIFRINLFHLYDVKLK
jgi:hypothetical protein